MAADDFPAVPASWAADPTAQLRALRDEVARQRDFPTPETPSFMDSAREALERLPETHFAPERVHALVDIARFFYLDGRADLAVKAGAAAVAAACLGSDRRLEARARMVHGTSLREAQDFVASMSELASALEIAQAEGDADWEAKILNNLGNWYTSVGLYAEALAIFERIARYFQASNDRVSLWMALDNAALACLTLGDVQNGIVFADRAAEVWPGEAKTALERLWVVQGMLTYCQLLIQADRASEAAACAHTARTVARDSRSAHAETLSAIAESITAFATGASGSETIERVIGQTRTESPMAFEIALDASLRVLERAGQFDRALGLQRELIALNKEKKFEAVRRILGRPSPEEADSAAKLAHLGTAVDRKITDLTNTAITQALRAGHNHARVFRVGRLAELFATSELWHPERVQSVALAAKLIDVGMMVIPDDLLSKPRQLSDAERRMIGEHAKFGAEVLLAARLALLEPCIPAVKFHHERWDGKGPWGLAGDDIPVEARAVALCDAFDALTHERPWRRAHSIPTALRIVGANAGSQFDPALSQRFVAWVQGEFWKVDDFEAHLAAEASDNSYVRMRERIRRLTPARGSTNELKN
jgi:HD-GYP domain-containing protein (c-di-GMP phosphodiesterase class II)